MEQLMVGFTIGITSGVGCAFTCIPLLVPRIAGSSPHLRGALFTSVTFSAGRLISYLFLGVGASLLGATFVSEAVRANLYPVAVSILGLVMIGYGISLVSGLRVGIRKYCGYLGNQRTTLLLGLVSSFSFCVPLIVALTYMVELGSPDLGLLFMVSFWAGTTLYMLLVGAVVGGAVKMGATLGNLTRIRRICGYASIMIGAVFLLNLPGSLILLPWP